MPFVEDIVEGHHFDPRSLSSVDILLNSDKADAHRRVFDLYVVTGFDVVTGKAAQILDDDCTNLTSLDHILHPLKVGAIEISSGVTVVCEEHGVAYSVFVNILLKDLSLIDRDGKNIGEVKDYNAEYCYIEVTDIPASKLGENYELKYGDVSLSSFSAFSYVKDVLQNDGGAQPITDTVTALYRYNEAAIKYFSSVA